MKKNILITGPPGVGKTTLLRAIVERLGDLALTGFYSEEIREAGIRVGFRAVALNGSTAIFAHRNFRTPVEHCVGKYGVKPEVLESLVLPHLDPERKRADLVVVDEMARMELLSTAIKDSFLRILESDCPLLGTIAQRGTGLVKRVKVRPDVSVFRVTLRNRDVLGQQLYRELREVVEGRRALLRSQARPSPKLVEEK